MNKKDRNLMKSQNKTFTKAQRGAAILNKMYSEMNRNERRKLSEILQESDIEQLKKTGLSYRLIVQQRIQNIQNEKDGSPIGDNAGKHI